MSMSLAVRDPRFTAVQAGLAQTPWVIDCFPEQTGSGAALHFNPDQEIYAEGDEATNFYKVVSGVIRTCKFLSDGRRQIDAFYGEGEVFGFETGREHRLSAEAVSDCIVVPYRRRGFGTLAGG